MTTVYRLTEAESRDWADPAKREAIKDRAWNHGALEIRSCADQRVWIMDAAPWSRLVGHASKP